MLAVCALAPSLRAARWPGSVRVVFLIAVGTIAYLYRELLARDVVPIYDYTVAKTFRGPPRPRSRSPWRPRSRSRSCSATTAVDRFIAANEQEAQQLERALENEQRLLG